MTLVPALLVLMVAQQGGEEFEAMRKRVAQDRVRVRFLEHEEASILGGLQGLDRALSEKHRTAKKLFDQIKKLESTIELLDREIAENEESLADVRERAGVRAAGMHRLQRTRLSDLFQHIRDPQRVRRLRDYLRRVLSYDAELISTARKASDGARSARDKAKARQEELASTKLKLETEVEDGAMLREERSALLDAVRKERKASQRLANEIVSASKRLEKELGVVRGLGPEPEPAPGGFDAQQGKLPWPVVGRVEVPFGKKVDPGSGMVMVQKGIDVRAAIASDVRAVFKGRVAYAEWFEGFGRLVILEHDGGFYTLYAHLESIEVEKGQSVNAYQVIGLVGDSGSTKGAYLYFEVRRGKDPVDPLRWLAP